MHPAYIHAAIKECGLNQVRIAENLDVSPSTVRHVITGHTKSRRIAQAIAQLTGKSLEELWPGKYASKARRKRQQTEDIARRLAAHRSQSAQP